MRHTQAILFFFATLVSAAAVADIEHFSIEQDGGACKAATPETKGTTLDRNFQLGSQAGWVYCTIEQRAPYYTGFNWSDLRVSELFLAYTIPTAPSIGGLHSIQYSTSTKSRQSKFGVVTNRVFGCTMDGIGPLQEHKPHAISYLRFYNGSTEKLPSYVLCYLPAESTIHSLTWSYYTNDDY